MGEGDLRRKSVTKGRAPLPDSSAGAQPSDHPVIVLVQLREHRLGLDHLLLRQQAHQLRLQRQEEDTAQWSNVQPVQRQKEDNIQWSNVQPVHSDRKRTIFSGQMSSSSTATSVVPLGWGKVFQIGIGLSVCPLSSSSTATERGQHSTSMVKINVQLVQTNRERTTRSGQMSSSSTATERGQHSTLNGQD